MRRIQIAPRPGWQQKVEQWGLVFHTLEGEPYWDESAYYRFDADEIDTLERATNELHQMCLKAVQYVIDGKRYAELAIPPQAVPVIEWSWTHDVPSLYGRFDLGFSGADQPKLLEYNADTPTSLLEAAVIQWQWLQEIFPDKDQFNSIWEGLVERWQALKESKCLKGQIVHFAHQDSIEDGMTVTMLRDTAEEAGLPTEGMLVEEIGWDSKNDRFADVQNRPMRTTFKLYPWEWMLSDTFGRHALDTYRDTQWIEPIWKMILSNKGILAILWELFPGHPYLLEAHIGDPRDLGEYVKKPLLGREGANVAVNARTGAIATEGDYGAEGFVYQKLYSLPCVDGSFPVLGSWVIDGSSRGMGIRESSTPITDDRARFVPHWFE